jgi:hypothetical protein
VQKKHTKLKEKSYVKQVSAKGEIMCLGFIAAFLLFVIFLFVLVAMGVDGEAAITVSAVSICIYIVAIVYNNFQGSKNKKKLKELAIAFVNNLEGFTPNYIFVKEDSSALIAICDNPAAILFGAINIEEDVLAEEHPNIVKHTILKVKDVIEFDVLINNRGTFSANSTTNSLGMAAVGGALFGSTGAIVGAITGSNDKTKVSLVAIQFIVDCMDIPQICFVFYDNGTKESGEPVQKYIDDATQCYNMVKVLKYRESKNDASNNGVS